MAKEFYLTFDFGSGSVKAALFDGNYRLLGSHNEAYRTYFPRNGWATQKPEEQWQAMIRASGAVLGKTGVPASSVSGLAMAQTATSVIFADESGRALTDCVMWTDGRAGEQADKINSLLGEKKFNGKNVISKLLWFEENEPEVVKNASYMLDLSSWLFHKMTDEFAYEFTGARATCLVDIENKCWDQRMFDLIGFPRRLVPERIAVSTEKIGVLTQEAASQMGLEAGTPVFGGTSDHAAAILGTGCIRPGDSHIYMGTSAWLAIVTSKDDPHPGRMPSPVPGLKYHFYDTDSGGACIDFLADNFYSAEKQSGADVYGLIDREIQTEISSGKHENVIFLPFLSGASAPLSDLTVRGTLMNLKRSTKRGDIARAFFEGLCYNMRLMRDIHAQTSSRDVNFLRAVGGVFENETLPQILADVLQTPVTTLENPRFAGALGLASCIDIGLNPQKDFTLLDNAVRERKTFEPDLSEKNRYDTLYGIYRKTFEAMQPIYRKLNG
ncbi:MAG: xylulokinase [Bilifractor sp.]|jgi:xylulokinase